MNKIDSRFLNFDNVVLGKRNAPGNSYAGYQVIVGDTPTGDFEGVTPCSLARYDGDRWIFTSPSEKLPYVFDVSTGHVLACSQSYGKWSWYAISGWSEGESNGSSRRFGECILREASSLATMSGDTLPSTCEQGESFLNTSDKKIYTATGKNTWNDGVELEKGAYLTKLNSVDFGILYYNGESIEADRIERNCLITVGDELFYCSTIKVWRIYPVDTSPIASEVAASLNKTVTESHTLTYDEVSAKEFTLAHSVVSGEEDNALCFVQGLAQAAGEAFTVSGNTLSWDGKTLEGNLNAGDKIIIQYVKASA